MSTVLKRGFTRLAVFVHRHHALLSLYRFARYNRAPVDSDDAKTTLPHKSNRTVTFWPLLHAFPRASALPPTPSRRTLLSLLLTHAERRSAQPMEPDQNHFSFIARRKRDARTGFVTCHRFRK